MERKNEEQEKEWEIIPWSEETTINEGEEAGWDRCFTGTNHEESIQQIMSPNIFGENNPTQSPQVELEVENSVNNQSAHSQLLGFTSQAKVFPPQNVMCECPAIPSLFPRFLKRWIIFPSCAEYCTR
eukprot:c12586_g1_i2.p1 GENE.c12586_g1_i2~~c12586_g1_i2.p1  ORF type:complete len:127 (+),score=60.59 c12586_g1_i2:100-480(+)